MSGCQTIRPQFARQPEQIREFHPHIAANTGDRRTAAQILIGELVDYRIAKTAFMVEDIMRDSQFIRDRSCISDILPCTAGFARVGEHSIIDGDCDNRSQIHNLQNSRRAFHN